MILKKTTFSDLGNCFTHCSLETLGSQVSFRWFLICTALTKQGCTVLPVGKNSVTNELKCPKIKMMQGLKLCLTVLY